jgi:hypothetical protein
VSPAYSTLNMKAADSSETLVSIYQITRRRISVNDHCNDGTNLCCMHPLSEIVTQLQAVQTYMGIYNGGNARRHRASPSEPSTLRRTSFGEDKIRIRSFTLRHKRMRLHQKIYTQ